MPDTQHILRTVSTGRNRDGQRSCIKIGRIDILNPGVETLLDDDSPGPLCVILAITGKIGNGWRIVHRRHTDIDDIRRTRERRRASVTRRGDFGSRRPARLIPGP